MKRLLIVMLAVSSANIMAASYYPKTPARRLEQEK